MRALAIAFIIFTSQASAQQMSPVGCNALSDAAINAADTMNGVVTKLTGDAFRKAMPVMPEKAKAPAADVEDARIAAQMALQEYQHALRDFSAAIHDCGQ